MVEGWQGGDIGMKEKENTMCGWRQMAEEGEDEGREGEMAGDKGSGRFFFF